MTLRPLSLAPAWIGAALTIGLAGLPAFAGDDDLARELPRIKPLDPTPR